jgi:hypothetical protein
MSRLAFAFALLGCAACERDPREVDCPDADAGDLVITELRGPQSGSADAYGEWIELYNASGGNIFLRGAIIRLTRLDGSSGGRILVRDPDLSVGPGEYVVLGRANPGQELEHVDYGYADDFNRSLFTSAAIDVLACDRHIDRTIYRNLPTSGTLALDGNIDPPSAAASDDESAWCVDNAADAATPVAGFRGTPRERNRPCD